MHNNQLLLITTHAQNSPIGHDNTRWFRYQKKHINSVIRWKVIFILCCTHTPQNLKNKEQEDGIWGVLGWLLCTQKKMLKPLPMSLQIDVTKGYYWYYINNINVQYCTHLHNVYNIVNIWIKYIMLYIHFLFFIFQVRDRNIVSREKENVYKSGNHLSRQRGKTYIIV